MRTDVARLKLDNPFLVFGSYLVLSAFLLAVFGGRWMSYLGFPGSGIYLLDILFIGGTLICRIFGRHKGGNLWLFELILLTYIAFQLLRNLDLPLLTRMRDLIPFIYLLCIPGAIRAISLFSDRNIIRLLRIASLLHFSWAIPAAVGIIPTFNISGFGVPVFSERQDFTGVILAIGILVWNSWPKLEIKGSLSIVALFFSGALILGSRAGFLASLFALLCIVFTKLKLRQENTNQSKIDVLFALGVVMLGITLSLPANMLPESSSIRRLGILTSSDGIAAQAEATANARLLAHQRLYNWISEQDKLVFGVGPGVEMVALSGAYLTLSGSQDVRSPHSWITGCIGRYGFFGLFLWILLVASRLNLGRKWKLSAFLGFPHNSLVVLILASMFGVIVESPFGSLVFSFLIAQANRFYYATPK